MTSELTQECIIGADFLLENKCIIDLHNRALLAGGQTTQFLVQGSSRSSLSVCHVFFPETTVLPGNSEVQLPLSLSTTTDQGMHSKNSGMTFIPKEYDVHTRRFHTHGMNSASMTFILFRSMRFIPRMRKYVRHTESRYELHTALYTDAESMTFIPNRGMNFTPRYLQIQGV